MRRWAFPTPPTVRTLAAVCCPIWFGAHASGEDDPLARLRPHPVISEVLFNVPNSDAGDADGDGVRNATGDEFVEIVNPHSKSVNLKGYTLTSRLSIGDATGKKGVLFTFPALELPPGAVVVVFNGLGSGLEGPVGTSERAPEKVHAAFGKAAVFSMENTAKNRAWSNSGDFVLLSAPDGTPVDALWWGTCSPMPPEETVRIAEVEASPKGSVHRPAPDEAPVPHTELDGGVCSPGTIPAPDGGKP